MFNNDIIMTQEIITINRNVFIEKKINKINEIIKAKYDDIYKIYQCFTVTTLIPPSIVKYHEDNRVYKNRKKIEKKEESYFTNRKKDLHKTVLGIFNILNRDNYNKMLSKMRLIKNEVNIAFIINDLLDKCTIQIFYLNIYIRFLYDIEKLCTPQERLLVVNCFNVFIKDHVNKREWITEKIIESYSDYNAFCDSQKRKNIILAKNKILCNLFNMYNDLDIGIDDYIIQLVNDLKSLCFSDNKVDNDDCNIILIVQMILDIIKSYKQYNNQINFQILQESLDDIKNTISNKKLQFLIEDFAKLI